MPETGTSGLMSGDGKRSDGQNWPKPPRPSSTLPRRFFRLMATTVSGGCRSPVRTRTAIHLAHSSTAGLPCCELPPVSSFPLAPAARFRHNARSPAPVGGLTGLLVWARWRASLMAGTAAVPLRSPVSPLLGLSWWAFPGPDRGYAPECIEQRSVSGVWRRSRHRGLSNRSR